jgi:hypothetical protein
MSAHSPTAAVRSQISSIVIRPARAGDTEAIARVRVDSWRETYRGMIPQAYLDANETRAKPRAVGKSAHRRLHRGLCFVAERGAEIVGVSVGAHRQSPGRTAVGNDFAVICVPLARSQGRGPRAISKRIKENKQ